MTNHDIAEIGSLPTVGDVPRRMHAQVIRSERMGDPRLAFVQEEMDVPQLRPHEVLVAVMAAGINFNNVWAARGTPVDVIKTRHKSGDENDFHIGGSDASGIVYKVGSAVKSVQVGERIVTHPGYWDPEDPNVLAGDDPMLSASARIWGYDTNFGSFAQFAVVQDHQCMPKAAHLSWEEAAAPGLVGATAYRMLHGWAGNTVSEEDVVLIWGGSGGVGGQAIQLVNLAGGTPIAVVSDKERAEYCLGLGAKGCIDRTKFEHWGLEPDWTDSTAQSRWTAEVRRFGREIWNIVGERRSPAIVVEHPGQDTMGTSVVTCERGGMVVICAGTTGYTPVIDLRHVWVGQKRVQGSHGTNDENAYAYNDLVRSEKIDPCLGEVITFDQIGNAHYRMGEGKSAPGNCVALVGASAPGLGRD